MNRQVLHRTSLENDPIVSRRRQRGGVIVPFLLVAALFSAASNAEGAQPLLGVHWSAPDQLEALIQAGAVIRYIRPQQIFVEGGGRVEGRLAALGLTPFLVDSAPPGHDYFLTDHLHEPLPDGVQLLYRDPAGWALLRLPSAELARVGEELHFLWPLPDRYQIDGWSQGVSSAKPTTPLGPAAVADLIAQVEVGRLQAHIRSLALVDPEGPNSLGNLRTRYAAHPRTFEATQYIRDQLARYLGPEAVEIQAFTAGVSDSVMYNVVATLPGTDPEAGYYVVCAHYDAIATRTRDADLDCEGCRWDWRIDPAPGADDNASGVSLVLESARVLAEQRLPWSVRFIAFSGEELGLWGSRAYATDAQEADERIIGVLNFDMIGFNDLRDRLHLVANPASRWLVDLMAGSNDRFQIGLELDILEDPRAGLSDHEPFWARGYDAILGIENYLPTDPTTHLYRTNTQYHRVTDVPDSISNWELVRRTTQLAIATLAQYGFEPPPGARANLAVFSGDLDSNPQDELRLRVSNTGLVGLDESFRVRVWRCATDSTDCQVIYDDLQAGGLGPGGVRDINIAQRLFGEVTFLLQVDPDGDIDEVSRADNQAFQRVRLVPQQEIVAYPNPYRPGIDPFLAFSGLPLRSRLRISTLQGELVWAAAEEQQGQLAREIRWRGENDQGFAASSGVYIYTITTQDGDLLKQDKVALIR